MQFSKLQVYKNTRELTSGINRFVCSKMPISMVSPRWNQGCHPPYGAAYWHGRMQGSSFSWSSVVSGWVNKSRMTLYMSTKLYGVRAWVIPMVQQMWLNWLSNTWMSCSTSQTFKKQHHEANAHLLWNCSQEAPTAGSWSRRQTYHRCLHNDPQETRQKCFPGGCHDGCQLCRNCHHRIATHLQVGHDMWLAVYYHLAAIEDHSITNLLPPLFLTWCKLPTWLLATPSTVILPSAGSVNS